MGWGSLEVVLVGMASLAVIAAFIFWEARSRHPMLKLRFFADRRFSVAAAAETLGSFGLLGALFLQTQFLQFDLGYSPLQAGVRILPLAGLLVASAAMSPMVVRAVGVKLTVAAGLAAVAGGLWQISAVSRLAASYGDVVPGLLLIGLGTGLLFPPRRTLSWIGRPERLRGRLGLQRRGASGRRRSRRRRHRKRDVDPLS